MRILVIVSVLAAALAACGPKGGAVVSRDGSTTTVQTANGTFTAGKAPPANLPDFARIYPGAEVKAAVQTPNGGVVGFETTDPPEKVLDFYKAQAAAAHLKVSMDSSQFGNDQQGAHVILFADETAGGKRNLQASAQVQDGRTHVSLSYGIS